MRRWILPLLTLACGGDADKASDTSAVGSATTPTTPCDYPSGVADPMTLGEVMPAFRWPSAKSLVDGTKTAFDLAEVHCGASADIDWSPFDILLFVSVPAW